MTVGCVECMHDVDVVQPGGYLDLSLCGQLTQVNIVNPSLLKSGGHRWCQWVVVVMGGSIAGL
jgi:hypothetical protein